MDRSKSKCRYCLQDPMTKSHNDHPSNGTRLARLRHRETYESATFCPPADHLVSWCRIGPKGHDESATPTKRSHHGTRVVLSIDLERDARDALRERAAAAGVSLTAYVRNAIALPERAYQTSAADLARPLMDISAALAQLRRILVAHGNPEALAALDAARHVLAQALFPLSRQHDAEVRANERGAR